MEQYAPIGKMILKNAVGLQCNYKKIETVVVTRLDEKASGCLECHNYSLKKFYESRPDSNEYLNVCMTCTNCPFRVEHQVTEEKVRYINENNRYSSKTGYSETLKANGIKLLLVLHMMHPNRYGHIFDISIRELKNILSCDRKTILSNLDTLKEYDYIDYIKTDHRGFINVLIKGYENYFKPADKGGRGYMTFSLELINALLEIKNLTTLRIFLHQLIDTDNHNDTEKAIFKKSYKELKNCLPRYYKPNQIKKGLTNNLDNPIFTMTVGDSVTFQLNPDYNAKKVKEKVIQNGRIAIMNHLDVLNDTFEIINDTDKQAEELLPDIFWKNNPNCKYPSYSLNLTIIGELAKMTWQYSLYDILDAIDYIYVNYILNNIPIENYPGLVRAIIPKIQELRSIISLAA